jgi:hypothetical protein
VFCNPGREEKSGRFTETEKHPAPPDSLHFQRLTTQKNAADFSAALQ